MIRTLATLAITIFLVSSVSAIPLWQMHDFGTEAFDENNNWSPINYPYGIGNLPSPGFLGEGGENFDLEGFHFNQSDGKVNLAVVNSFGYGGYSSSWDQTYYMGDIFFGFNGNENQYGIDVSTGRLYQVDSWNGISNKPGTYYGTDIETQIGAWEIGSGTDLGSVLDVQTLHQGLESNPLQGNGDTYIWEFSFDAAMIQEFGDYEDINFNVSMECGNDQMSKSYPAVPEPITLILMGIGLAGMGTYRRITKS